ncbi:methionine repressor-like protein [Melaminivora suipulveris]|uniref:Methionine repressor-like protein n=1 Tax=Melaminivora suipulveris TaxID=2109913 RepID=A0A2R3QBK0_9BURK|nr:ribbon-helix-helix domain-containing protein [Melaminivora suipulveris]AVO49156.1 methionine repressor-like protein [Melaminivora suipulveris]
MNTVRWNLAVSPEVDQSVRRFLAAQGSRGEGDLSRLIEEAVRSYLFERATEQARQATAPLSAAELDELLDDAVQWARKSA